MLYFDLAIPVVVVTVTVLVHTITANCVHVHMS